MATSKDYLNFILDQLSGLDEITYRSMMGEYIIYYSGKVTAYLCDDRLLVKPVPSAVSIMPDAKYEPPYDGAKDMLLVENVDDRNFLEMLFRTMYSELPMQKIKKKRKSKIIQIGYGMQTDIHGWMSLVQKMSSCFPGLETEAALAEHRQTVLDFMSRQEAICARENGVVIGALLFSKESNILCFLAVDPIYRRQHIAEKMFQFMLPHMNTDKAITVTTYREGVPEGIAARAFYQKLGFVQGKLTVEFGSEVQEFALNIKK